MYGDDKMLPTRIPLLGKPGTREPDLCRDAKVYNSPKIAGAK